MPGSPITYILYHSPTPTKFQQLNYCGQSRASFSSRAVRRELKNRPIASYHISRDLNIVLREPSSKRLCKGMLSADVCVHGPELGVSEDKQNMCQLCAYIIVIRLSLPPIHTDVFSPNLMPPNWYIEIY